MDTHAKALKTNKKVFAEAFKGGNGLAGEPVEVDLFAVATGGLHGLAGKGLNQFFQYHYRRAFGHEVVVLLGKKQILGRDGESEGPKDGKSGRWWSWLQEGFA